MMLRGIYVFESAVRVELLRDILLLVHLLLMGICCSWEKVIGGVGNRLNSESLYSGQG